MIVAPHLAGSTLRVHLSNRFGLLPVTLGPVTIGLQSSGASLVPGTERAVTFNGQATVTIPPGEDVVSDPVDLTFAAFQDLAVSVDVSGVVIDPTEHFITRQTSYLSPVLSGDHSADISGSAFTQTTTGVYSTGWYFLDGIDVLAPGSQGAVVAFGDSITDGYQGILGSTEQLATINTNGRYPDDLARRLIAAKIPLSVLNAGIGGNMLLTTGGPSGPSGLARFATDALDQAGVTDVIVLEGINDISAGATASQIIGGYEQLIAQAHSAGVHIQLGTITPAEGSTFASGDAASEVIREQVNQWIRTQTLSDGVIDFDAAVRDPSDPSEVNPAYDGGDHIHFNLAGYQAMANAISVSMLERPQCTIVAPVARVWASAAASRRPAHPGLMVHWSGTDTNDPGAAPAFTVQVQRTAHHRSGVSHWQTLAGLAATTKTSVWIALHPSEKLRFRVRVTGGSGVDGRWATTSSLS